MPKILLIIPPCFTNRELDFEIGFPVNIALLGDLAQREGCDVEYLDMTLEEKEGYDSFAELEHKLEDDDIDLVGISNHTVRTSITTQRVAEHVKCFKPHVKVVVGGVNATFMTRELLESCAAIDYVIRGYAQPGFRALLRSTETDGAAIPGMSRIISGILYEEPMTAITCKDFPRPSLRGLDVPRYLEWTTTYPLLTHTGCGFSCNFCTSVMPGPYQNREVYRPIEDVIKEMRTSLSLGFNRFFMSDNVFTSSKDYCLSLCAAMKSGGIASGCTWVCMTRVEFVDRELLSALREAGCINIAFGVETAGVDQWKSLRKGRFSDEVVKRAFHLSSEVGLGTTAYLMLGSPSQTEHDLDATVELIGEIDPDYRVVSFFQPFPGTAYWNHPEKFGISEIASLDQWNFHESPICRTANLSKSQLMSAAMRLYLARGKKWAVEPSLNSIEFRSLNSSGPAQAPFVLRELLEQNDHPLTIQQMFDAIAFKHGTRDLLITLSWISSALRDGFARIIERPEPASGN